MSGIRFVSYLAGNSSDLLVQLFSNKRKCCFSGFRIWNGLDQNTWKDVLKQSVEVFEPWTEHETAVRFLNPPTSTWSMLVSYFRSRPHYAGEIWKLFFSPWKLVKWFPSTLHQRSLKTQQSSVSLENFGREITLFSKSSVFKMFPVFLRCSVDGNHLMSFQGENKSQNRRFQIPPVWRAFSKSFVFVTDQCRR